jgi:hypothetical protein
MPLTAVRTIFDQGKTPLTAVINISGGEKCL